MLGIIWLTGAILLALGTAFYHGFYAVHIDHEGGEIFGYGALVLFWPAVLAICTVIIVIGAPLYGMYLLGRRIRDKKHNNKAN